MRQGSEQKFSVRITSYRGTRAANVALGPGDRLSTGRSNLTYFGDSWTSHIHEPESKWSTQLRFDDSTIFYLHNNIFKIPYRIWMRLGSKCNEPKLHLEGARLISRPWFGYRYTDCPVSPAVNRKRIARCLLRYRSFIDIRCRILCYRDWRIVTDLIEVAPWLACSCCLNIAMEMLRKTMSMTTVQQISRLMRCEYFMKTFLHFPLRHS